MNTLLFAQAPATISVTVLNTKNQPYSGDKIYFVGQQTKRSFSGVTNAKGKFNIDLPQGDVYDIRIKSIGEELEYNTLEIPTIGEGQFFEKMEIAITYEAAKSYTLSNLQFEVAKATIRSSSYQQLDDLVEILTLKPTMKIEIGGHTDSDGDDQSNLLLSQQRADAVKSYLIKKGISATRIASKGYGETRPVGDNATTAGKQKNRRTEIRVL